MLRGVMAYVSDPKDRDVADEGGVVESADIWDDQPEPTGAGQVGSAIGARLPVRKPACQRAGRAAGATREGLRIESNLSGGGQSPGRPPQLEVQQIGMEVVRLAPDEAPAPWGPRQMVHRARGTAKRSRDVTSGWGQATQLPLRWIVGTGLGVFIVVLTALLFLPLINRSNAAGSFRPTTYVVARPPKVDPGDAVANLLGREAEAGQLLHVVVTARTADELLPLVRDAAANEPMIRANPRLATLRSIVPPHSTSRWQVKDHGGRIFGLLDSAAAEATGCGAYWVLEGNQLLLDWKASAGYGTAGFEELVAGHGDGTEIRGTIRPANFYTGVYPEEQFQCFQLESPDRSESIWTYAPRGEAPASEIDDYCRGDELLERKLEPRKVTVSLARGPAGAQANQWKIVTMLHKEWIQP